MLEHADEPEALVRRYARFLKPGGSLFVTVPNAASTHRRIGFAAGLMHDLFALGAGDRQLGHQQLFSVASLTALIERCWGLEVVVTEGLFFKPFTNGATQQLGLSDATLSRFDEGWGGWLSRALLCASIDSRAAAEARGPAMRIALGGSRSRRRRVPEGST